MWHVLAHVRTCGPCGREHGPVLQIFQDFEIKLYAEFGS